MARVLREACQKTLSRDVAFLEGYVMGKVRKPTSNKGVLWPSYIQRLDIDSVFNEIRSS